MNPLAAALDTTWAQLEPELLAIYRDLHQHPELSMQETRTAAIAADSRSRLPAARTNLAIREAAFVALGFNVLLVASVLVVISLTMPRQLAEVDLPSLARTPDG